ncbi:glycoside hydrolase family 88 protein [Rosettibacter firmus]|uniref:glycoside hydrolase family 88 protein n=1 Tax=Rosettibacter firmus TaxID=3111522 RepID=UPI00336BBF89
MNRKSFLKIIPLAGILLSSQNDLIFSKGKEKNQNIFKNKSTLEKVKLAMLSMQRATWEQGVAMQAMLESGEEELVILMAKEAVLRQSPDGRLAMLGEEFALSDACSPGEAVLWAAKKTGDESLMNGFNKLLDYIMNKAPRNKDGIIYHFTNVPQIWSDINYMLPPFLAVAKKYEEAVKQIEGAFSCLWNPDKKLLSHMWDCEKNEFVRKDCWGVGNGWSAAGLTRVINMLPDSMQQEKNKLINYVKDIIDGCIAHIREDGLFHNIVDNPNSFVETNLSQMLAYTIYRGIKSGWLDKSYKKYADKMRTAAHSKVDKLGLVQGVCGSPEFDHPGTATEGQAFFILMEAAYRDLNS